MSTTHPTLILEIGDDFPEPSMEFFLHYVIKKTGLNEAELWTCRGNYQRGNVTTIVDLYWDRIPTKEEKRLWDTYVKVDRPPLGDIVK